MKKKNREEILLEFRTDKIFLLESAAISLRKALIDMEIAKGYSVTDVEKKTLEGLTKKTKSMLKDITEMYMNIGGGIKWIRKIK